MMKVLIVGAGFAGAVHARELAEAGVHVEVIDRRSHKCGNAFEEAVAGCNIHKYGPHLFHTSNTRVVQWLSRFTSWSTYHHKVKASLPNGRLVPLPINLETLRIFSSKPIYSDIEAQEYLNRVRVECPKPENAKQWLEAQLGEQLTELFYSRYTRKMWGVSIDTVEVGVVSRLKVRFSENDDYFLDDTFQAMPKYGYNQLFDAIFDHPNISINLLTPFRNDMLRDFDFCFNSMAIDEFFGFELGELPYRSIKFHHTVVPKDDSPAVTNFTDCGPFTRQTRWQCIPSCGGGTQEVITKEEPCDYQDNAMERFYPLSIRDDDLKRRIQGYKELASKLDNMRFIGRCGTYQYLDMHQVINQSLQSVRGWLNDRNLIY